MLSRIARFAASVGHARARYLLVCGGLLIGLIVAAGIVLLLAQLRQGDIDDTEREQKNISLILAEETDRSFQAAELVQLGVIQHLRDLGIDSPEKFADRVISIEMRRDLQDRIASLPDIDGVSLIDLHGKIINNSRYWSGPVVDVSDRDVFTDLIGEASPPSFIGRPVLSRSSGVWTILFARKFTTADGKLLGIVSCGIKLARLEGLFAAISLNEGGAFALYRRDGMLMARYPHAAPNIGETLGDTANFGRFIASLDSGTTRLISTLDGQDRLVAPHSLTHYPLVIAVSTTVDSLLGTWREEVRLFGGGAVLLELVIAGIIVLGVRHLRSYESLQVAEGARARAESDLALAEERERAGQILHLQEQRFDTALHNMMQGLFMVDHAGNVLVVNRRFSALFGLPPDIVRPGMSYAELMNHLAASGNVQPVDAAEIIQRRKELIDENVWSTFVWELSDGRAFTVTHQPMEEGWLTTVEDITGRRVAEARIAHLAHHDALTNLPNRVLFHERLELALAHARRGQGLALLFLDLDHFKTVNDTLGHPIGDALLQAVAQRLREGLREIDMIARLGGDEFAIIQTAIESPVDATELAGRLIGLIAAPFEIDGHQIVTGTSIGIALAPQDGLDADQLLKCADLALYRAKMDGRSVFRLFQADMDAAMQARRVLEIDLRLALSAGQLEVFYQPLIDVQARRVAGFEALLRWRHPTNGLVPPDRFIPLAEETGMIVPIGEWVLRQACIAASGWPGAMKVAVNLSPVQFKGGNLVAVVMAAVTASGLPPGRLELEITETVMLQDTNATLATLHELRNLGIHVAMDDFGTGYSSLSYLRRFPFDRIKIDQSFVRELGTREDCIAIVRAVTTLGCDLGMATTAEGVETREQLEMLTGAGCTEVQGYLFSPAVPGAAVPELLRTVAEMLQPRVTTAVPERVA